MLKGCYNGENFFSKGKEADPGGKKLKILVPKKRSSKIFGSMRQKNVS